MNSHDLSEQMRAALHLLDTESPVPLCQLYQHLYEATRHQPRRAFAASLSRTLRRMERRGLITREDRTVAITQQGRFTLHPEMREAMLTEAREIGRKAFEQAWSEIKKSQAYQDLCKSIGI